MNISGNTSESFKSNNKIFFETKLLPHQGAENGDVRQVIDLNQDDKIAGARFIKQGSFLDNDVVTDRIDEPVIAESYKKLKDFARAQEKVVLTQDDLLLHVKEVTVDVTKDIPEVERESSRNLRSMSDLIKDASPFTPNAKWALDVVNDTFMVFEPKA